MVEQYEAAHDLLRFLESLKVRQASSILLNLEDNEGLDWARCNGCDLAKINCNCDIYYNYDYDNWDIDDKKEDQGDNKPPSNGTSV